MTLVSPNPRPDDVYEELRGQFSEEVVKLTVAVAAIKAWNRIAISFRAVHRVRKPHAACRSADPGPGCVQDTGAGVVVRTRQARCRQADPI